MAEELASPRPRRSEPLVIAHYGMAGVTTRIDDLYERIAARRRPLPGITEVLPPLPTPRPADSPSAPSAPSTPSTPSSLVGGA
jgi:hypothetical protein